MTGNEATSWASFENTANKAEVLRFLNSAGFKIPKRSFYRDCQKGKLSVNDDGLYTRRLVKTYAKKYLLPPAGSGNTDDLESKKIRLQIEKLERENEEGAFKFSREKGKYIARDEINHEMAARAVVLDAGTEHLFRSNARKWCVLVGGDPERSQELVEAMLAGWHELLNEYSKPQTFTVIFETENEEGEEA